jgi:hypothetical protein
VGRSRGISHRGVVFPVLLTLLPPIFFFYRPFAEQPRIPGRHVRVRTGCDRVRLHPGYITTDRAERETRNNLPSGNEGRLVVAGSLLPVCVREQARPRWTTKDRRPVVTRRKKVSDRRRAYAQTPLVGSGGSHLLTIKQGKILPAPVLGKFVAAGPRCVHPADAKVCPSQRGPRGGTRVSSPARRTRCCRLSSQGWVPPSPPGFSALAFCAVPPPVDRGHVCPRLANHLPSPAHLIPTPPPLTIPVLFSAPAPAHLPQPMPTYHCHHPACKICITDSSSHPPLFLFGFFFYASLLDGRNCPSSRTFWPARCAVLAA